MQPPARPAPGRPERARQLAWALALSAVCGIVGGALAGSCAGEGAWERVRYEQLRSDDEATAAADAARQETTAPTGVAIGASALLVLLFAARRRREDAAVIVLLGGAAIGAAAAVAMNWIGMDVSPLRDPAWATLTAMGGAIVGAPVGLVLGAVMVVGLGAGQTRSMPRLAWLGVAAIAITMTLTSAAVGGAVVRGFADLDLGDDVALDGDGETTRAQLAAEEAVRHAEQVGIGSTAVFTLLVLLAALRARAAVTPVVAVPAATLGGALNAATLLSVLGGEWDPPFALFAAIVGAPFGLVFGLVLAAPVSFARVLIEAPSRPALERGLVVTGLLACGSLWIVARFADLPSTVTLLAAAVGAAVLAAGVGSFAARRWRIHALRRAPIELVPLDAADVLGAQHLSDGPAAWAVVERQRAGYRDRPVARWLLDEADAAELNVQRSSAPASQAAPVGRTPPSRSIPPSSVEQ